MLQGCGKSFCSQIAAQAFVRACAASGVLHLCPFTIGRLCDVLNSCLHELRFEITLLATLLQARGGPQAPHTAGAGRRNRPGGAPGSATGEAGTRQGAHSRGTTPTIVHHWGWARHASNVHIMDG